MVVNTNYFDFNYDEFILCEYFSYSTPIMKVASSLNVTMRMQDYLTKTSFAKGQRCKCDTKLYS